jgi:hypothetical protein
MTEFWTFSALELGEAGVRLKHEFRSSDPEFDAENLYHWFDVTAPDGLRLNVSRKHGEGQSDVAEPLRIRASGYRSFDDRGRRLATALRTTVYYGDVEYLGGDDFRYDAVTQYEPNT